MKPSKILGMHSVFPPYKYTQEEMMSAFVLNNLCSNRDLDFVQRVFSGTKIETCRSFLKKEDLFRRMDREEYIKYIKAGLKDMGISASKGAISEWGGDISEITHIIWGSMTGCIYAPTMDIEILTSLGLNNSVKRLNVENMGCLTGYRCLALADSIVKADPASKVLLVVGDIRSSLGNVFTHSTESLDRANVIVGALFRDSCAAAIIGHSEKCIYEILEHESFIIPDTLGLVKYSEKNGGFIHLNISKDLPQKICEHIDSLCIKLLSSCNVSLKECDIACHTGGPKVINGIRDSLCLDDTHFEATWYVLKNYGNLSGSSNLVVLDKNRSVSKREYCIGLSMGPGVCIELLLLRRC